MELKITDKRLVEDIVSYCDINEIEDISEFATKLLRKAFMVERYGLKPQIDNETVASNDEPMGSVEETIETSLDEPIMSQSGQSNETESIAKPKSKKRTLK